MSVEVRAPAYKILADDLRAQITSGQLRPGDRLPTEPQLCRSCGVSRSTVREALRLLASQNLIVTTRGVAGGSFVVHPSPDQLIDSLSLGVNLLTSSRLVTPRDILEARRIVEIPVAALAARRRSEADLEALRETLFDPHTEAIEVMAAVHASFHEALADACGNPLLTLIGKPLHRIASASKVFGQFGRPFWVQLDADHRAILDAVVAREPDRAEVATARHIDSLRLAFDPLPEPGVPERGVPEPGVPEPGVAELTEPSATEPSATEPSVTVPTATGRSVTEPGVTEPSVTGSSATELAVSVAGGA